MKNGPPTNAVITPIGSSWGATNVLEMVSPNTSNTLPVSADEISKNLLTPPASVLQICGAINPIKPIAPDNDFDE
ncbi:MAG: hypothetical protein ACI8Q1_000615 [Parvicella sp.]|jgi:hypothetical protein